VHIKTAIVGLGNVNRNLLNILAQKRERLERDYDVEFKIVLIADSSGVACNTDGFDPSTIVSAKASGRRVIDFDGALPGHTASKAICDCACDLVFEASPVDLKTGGPGLIVAREALKQGISIVLANKGPVVVAYNELHKLANENNAGLKYSATVCGGLPVLNIGQRDFIAADILKLRGIFNATSNFILDQMVEANSYEDSLAEAQRRGTAEADPSLDVEGWDSANKLLIIVNSIMQANISLDDITVTGISDITPEFLLSEKQKGNSVKLIASAENNRYSVSPVILPSTDFLAQCQGWEMAVEMHTDIFGIHYYKLWEREPIPTAAAMLRDAVHIFSAQREINVTRKKK